MLTLLKQHYAPHFQSTLSEGELKGQHANPNNNTAMYAGIGVGIVLAIALAAVIAYVIL